MDTFVKPEETVQDYRTTISGVNPNDLQNAPDFKATRARVLNYLKDCIVVGHSVDHDLEVGHCERFSCCNAAVKHSLGI
jgi:RNA exonuclease 4